jgi:hypothetical protein
MEGDIADLPNDVDALKAALTVERARIREVVAERDAGAAELGDPRNRRYPATTRCQRFRCRKSSPAPLV